MKARGRNLPGTLPLAHNPDRNPDPTPPHSPVERRRNETKIRIKNKTNPPRPSIRIITDIFAYTARFLPKWNPISISGYHIREAGCTAVQEIAFTLANAVAYVRAAVDAVPTGQVEPTAAMRAAASR